MYVYVRVYLINEIHTYILYTYILLSYYYIIVEFYLGTNMRVIYHFNPHFKVDFVF